MCRKLICSLVVVVVTMSSLTGCSSISYRTAEDLQEIPLVEPLTGKEVRDYYAKAIEVKDYELANKKKVTQTMELRVVQDDEKDKLDKEIARIEQLLSQEKYPGDESLKREAFETMKIFMDDRAYTRSDIIYTGAASENYIVDVVYTGIPKSEGNVKEDAKYLGIHGAFKLDELSASYVDRDFIKTMEKEVARDKTLEGLINGDVIADDIADRGMRIDTPAEVNNKTTENEVARDNTLEGLVNGDVIDNDITDSGMKIDTPAEVNNNTTNNASANNDTNGNTSDGIIDNAIDITTYNNSMGASITQTAFMPALDLVFKKANSGGKLGGYGIYAQGSNGMGSFGFNRKDSRAKMTVRYILERNFLDDSKVSLHSMYIKDFKMEGVPQLDTIEKDIFPQFIMDKIAETIDRSDRVKSNRDITGLANGEVYYDLRNAILWGHKANNNVFTHISQVDNYLKRNGNFYLVEVSTNVFSDIKNDKAGQAHYKDKYVVLIEQKQLEEEFVIVDWMRVGRETIVEPKLEFRNQKAQRYGEISLAGTVPEDIKPQVRGVMQDYYAMANEANWNGVKEYYNKDVEILSSTDREDIFSTVTKWCGKFGFGNEVTWKIRSSVIDWVGGTDSQVELISQELITYAGTDYSQLITSYYVLSKFENEWSIDDMRVIESTELSGDDTYKAIEEIDGYLANATIVKPSEIEDEVMVPQKEEDTYVQDIVKETENINYDELENEGGLTSPNK